MSTARDYVPSEADRTWIESVSAPLLPGAGGDRGGRGARGDPDPRPRVGPDPGGPRGRPAADRRGRHGLRLLDAVAGARPAGRRDDRHDRPGPVADRPRPRLVAPGRDRRRADRRRQPAGARGVRGRPRRAGPRRAVRPRLHRRPQGRVPRLPRGDRARGSHPARSSWPTTSSGPARCPARGRPGGGDATEALRTFDTGPSCATRASTPPSCPSATGCSSPRTAADGAMRIRVRLFAIQRELAGTREVALDLDGRCHDRGRLGRARRSGSRSSHRVGRRSASPATATTPTRPRSCRRRRAGLHPPGQRRRRAAARRSG